MEVGLEEAKERAWRRALETEVSAWGFRVTGRAERPHRLEPMLCYRAFWIDAVQAL
jgi:hypothetical protein